MSAHIVQYMHKANAACCCIDRHDR